MSNQFEAGKLALLVLAIVLLFAPNRIQADPCGMVPPIRLGPNASIARIGLQKTYVFYKDGVETFVIRPGFQGNIDNFGMLIPFPSPPELRKVPDQIFDHVAKAIDPPEVVVDLRIRALPAAAIGGGGGAVADGAMEFYQRRKSVRVIKQEAVGMYEVAVLEAGSAEALKKWMDQNGYRYPNGMDAVTEDYVKIGWCFVAVKTKVGNLGAVQPKPGQKQVRPNLPPGSEFGGYVQGMGFRFKTDELVVPMRLSTFNSDELRNVVYLLSDSPRKIRNIPEEFVVRQIAGKKLLQNLTSPLPLRILGGTEKDLPTWERRNLTQRRNPTPHNGLAKQLFADDLLAVATGNLTLRHEQMEKELLRVGEHFGLRGPAVDAENALALTKMKEKSVEAGLQLLSKMTMTVVDGDFPRDVLANENLKFVKFQMADAKNKPEFYEAPRFGAGGKKPGIRKEGKLDSNPQNPKPKRVSSSNAIPKAFNDVAVYAAISMILIGALGWIGLCGKFRFLQLLVFVAAVSIASNVFADKGLTETSQPDHQLVEQLMSESAGKKETIQEIVEFAKLKNQNRNKMLRQLYKIADDPNAEIPNRGWAIAAISQIGGLEADEKLLDIHSNDKHEKLVRTWAAAGRVSMTRTLNGLIEKANLIPAFPALQRPLGLRIVSMLNENESLDTEKLIKAGIKIPTIQQALAPIILNMGAEKLSNVMISADENNIRNRAAAYLGALANQGQTGAVAELVTTAIQFEKEADGVPWDGGALFIPGIQWDKPAARQLVGQLIRWHLWCDIHKDSATQTQIHNNLRSVSLARSAGYQSPGFRNIPTKDWLVAWGNAVGKQEILDLLQEQGQANNQKYTSALKKIR